MLITFLLAGRMIEIHARKHNLVAIGALRRLMPEVARVIQQSGIKETVALESVRPGTLVYVQAGERIPIDGLIETGASQIDASLLTGESLPQRRETGERVQAGMVNLMSPLTLRAEQTLGERQVDKLGLRMLELFGAKSSMSKLAEQFARWLLPIACAVSLLALIRHLWMGMAADAAVLASLSILVAACPCAIGLALPLAFSAGSTRASHGGILFRDPASVEALARVRTFAFDKTGTLTTGDLTVARITSKRLPNKELLGVVANAEAGIAHPVADAIVSHAYALGIANVTPASNVERHAAGVVYTAPDGERWLIGAADWLAQEDVRGIEKHDAHPESKTSSAPSATVHVARNGCWEGRIELEDSIRKDSLDALRALRSEGCRTLLITGDHRIAAEWVGGKLAFDPEHIHAACGPDEKVRVLQAHGASTAFVGDGINDTLVLAAADCGVAINGANAVAVTASGVVITRGGIAQVTLARSLAKRIIRRIRQNLFFSVIYNVTIVGLFLHIGVTPAAAAVAMLLSSMTVLANSARPFRL